MTTLHRFTNANAFSTAETINGLFDQAQGMDETLIVNGKEVQKRFFGPPADSWGTGSVSVTVKGRNPGCPGTEWISPGADYTYQITGA